MVIGALAAACKDSEVRVYLRDEVVPRLDSLGLGLCNIEIDQTPVDHPPFLRYCTPAGGGPPDHVTPPPPPPP
jgi:hypothetical protein